MGTVPNTHQGRAVVGTRNRPQLTPNGRWRELGTVPNSRQDALDRQRPYFFLIVTGMRTVVPESYAFSTRVAFCGFTQPGTLTVTDA